MTKINMMMPKATITIWISPQTQCQCWSIFDNMKMKLFRWGYFVSAEHAKSWSACLEKNFNAYENFMRNFK